MKFQGPEMISGETFQGPERSPGKSYSHLKEKEEGKDRISLEPLDSCTHGEQFSQNKDINPKKGWVIKGGG